MTWRRWLVSGMLVLGLIAVPRMDSLQARSGPAVDGLKGTYGIFFVVQSVATRQPQSGIGVVTLDGNGGLTGTQTINRGTTVCEVALTGTYSVDPDGTGRTSAASHSPIPACSFSFGSRFVILEAGALLKMITTDEGFVTLAEDWHRLPGS